MHPVTRPRGFAQQKYTIENCLPQLLHGTRPSTSEESGCPMVLTSPYPTLQPVSGGSHQHPHTPSHVVTMHVQHQQQPADNGHNYPHQTVRQPFTTQVPPADSPQVMQGVSPQLHSHGQQGAHPSYTPTSKRPLVAKIGAAGRRIADAVKQVGHHSSRGHSANSSRHGSAGSSRSIVS